MVILVKIAWFQIIENLITLQGPPPQTVSLWKGAHWAITFSYFHFHYSDLCQGWIHGWPSS